MNALTRRRFLRAAAAGSLGAAALSPAVEVLLRAGAAFAFPYPAPGRLREVPFYAKLGDGRIQCGVCPNACVLGDGERGRCRSRGNHGGIHYNHGYGNPCVLSVDPIEKLPLHNFTPGERVVSIAEGGCMLRCLYCQNWEFSQRAADAIPETYDLPPARAVHHVLEKEIRTLAFTYTDPIAFLEYLCEIADIARHQGVRCVAATSGYGRKHTLRRLAEKLDAITIGLKGFDEGFYRRTCGAHLKPVLDGIVEVKSSGTCWLEITTLVVPTLNDDLKSLKAMARWIVKNAGKRTPWHVARFVPRYKLQDLPRTPLETLDAARKIGLDAGLEYVYVSNVAPHQGNNTYCPRCGRPVIERVGFKVLKNAVRDGKCPCGQKISGFFGGGEKRAQPPRTAPAEPPPTGGRRTAARWRSIEQHGIRARKTSPYRRMRRPGTGPLPLRTARSDPTLQIRGSTDRTVTP